MYAQVWATMRFQTPDLMVAIVVWSTALSAMALTGCSVMAKPEAPDRVVAPAVVRMGSRELPSPTEAVILAHRILQRESGDLLVDAENRRALAGEIEPVLSRIRDAYPAARQTLPSPRPRGCHRYRGRPR